MEETLYIDKLLVVDDKAIYSDLVEDLDVVGCLLLCHEMGELLLKRR